MNLSVVNTPYLYEFVSCEYTLIYVNLSVVNTLMFIWICQLLIHQPYT